MNKNELIKLLAEIKFSAAQPRPADGVCKAVNQIADRYNISDDDIDDEVAKLYAKHHPIKPPSSDEFFKLINTITEDYKRNHGIE